MSGFVSFLKISPRDSDAQPIFNTPPVSNTPPILDSPPVFESPRIESAVPIVQPARRRTFQREQKAIVNTRVLLSNTPLVLNTPPVFNSRSPQIARRFQPLSGARIQKAAIAQDGHTMAEQLIYAALYNSGEGVVPYRDVCVGNKWIMSKTGLTERTVQLNLKSLQMKLSIEMVRRHNPDTNQPTVYRVYSLGKDVLERRRAAGLDLIARKRGGGVRLLSSNTPPVSNTGGVSETPLVSETPGPDVSETAGPHVSDASSLGNHLGKSIGIVVVHCPYGGYSNPSRSINCC